MDFAASLGALGFWIFLGAIIVAGIWYDARRKESEQETLRRIVESGRDIDPAVIDRVIGKGDTQNMARDLRVSGFITLAVAPGLLILSLFLGQIAEEARFAVMGASFLTACVGAGMLIAARFLVRSDGIH